ncbi:hypothetical protein L2E82_36887 [Cichorium intybus]|uniref:Uncharacterized protein n=1 Tax=Cichorium intybus TaxID=13427 RepID=A0ACB9AEZ4_CICIN|nr:hypothetical protein L2E82_36887 [Cichorium intybus]
MVFWCPCPVFQSISLSLAIGCVPTKTSLPPSHTYTHTAYSNYIDQIHNLPQLITVSVGRHRLPIKSNRT